MFQETLNRLTCSWFQALVRGKAEKDAWGKFVEVFECDAEELNFTLYPVGKYL